MEHGDVARLLNVADADLKSYVESDDGVSVQLTDGVARMWTPDGVFAVNDCPQNRNLRPLPEGLRNAGVVTEDSIDEDEAEVADAPEESPTTEAVPDGTADEVLSWVAGDPGRAALAIEAEEHRDKPRSVLLGNLRKVSQA